MRPNSALFSSVLLLAACGGGTENANTAEEESSARPVVQERVPENLTDDPRNEAVPLDPPPPSPGATPATLTAFPPAFRGRWGLVVADCQPGRSDAKGLMEVGPDTLRFYESRGTARKLVQPRPGRIEATLAFSGEGMEWSATQALTLTNDGQTLVREERDPPSSLRYTKCPA